MRTGAVVRSLPEPGKQRSSGRSSGAVGAATSAGSEEDRPSGLLQTPFKCHPVQELFAEIAPVKPGTLRVRLKFGPDRTHGPGKLREKLAHTERACPDWFVLRSYLF